MACCSTAATSRPCHINESYKDYSDFFMVPPLLVRWAWQGHLVSEHKLQVFAVCLCQHYFSSTVQYMPMFEHAGLAGSCANTVWVIHAPLDVVSQWIGPNGANRSVFHLICAISNLAWTSVRSELQSTVQHLMNHTYGIPQWLTMYLPWGQ